MTRSRATALILFIAFLVQLAVFMIVMEFGLPSEDAMAARALPEKAAELLYFAVMPGVQLFWEQGIHLDSGFRGLLLAVLINTAYYAAVIWLIVQLARRYSCP